MKRFLIKYIVTRHTFSSRTWATLGVAHFFLVRETNFRATYRQLNRKKHDGFAIQATGDQNLLRFESHLRILYDIKGTLGCPAH